FAVSLGDATLPLVLAIPNFSTLALYTYRLAGAFRFNQACACAVLMIILSMLPLVGAARASLRAKRGNP
ncbi:MAG: iron ABC transporter permease, partial [Treponema sp.]|nr:iron ABC transporter permease [Treponema sp.]